MPGLSTYYMGLNLKNPLIAGSSGLTARIESLLELERRNAAAVVLKSLFEEDILQQKKEGIPGGNSTLSGYKINASKAGQLDEYLRLIDECKRKMSIPVIASINCGSNYEWTNFARKIEAAGADALELNLFVLPSDPKRTSEENEKIYIEVVTEVRRQVKFPLAVKISPCFSDMTRMALKLSWTGISGLVLFNRFYQPDIDIEEMKTVSGRLLSSPEEVSLSLRWTALLSDRVMCDVAASTGVHDHKAVIKLLLAGARAVQVVSALYLYGTEHLEEMIQGLSTWMEEKNYQSISDFRGKLSLKKSENPAEYERYQYYRSLHPDE